MDDLCFFNGIIDPARLIRPALSVIIRLAVGCAMRTVEPFGAHGAPYEIMNNSCRINSAA
jgi:hypothetical protein